MIREKKPKDHREAEQEALLKNWLDGLEPLEKAEVQLALRHAPAIATIEEEQLEAMPSHEPFDVDRPEWILAEELNLGLEEAIRVLKWHERHVQREVEWAKAEQLTRIVGFLIKPCGNLRVIVRMYMDDEAAPGTAPGNAPGTVAAVPLFAISMIAMFTTSKVRTPLRAPPFSSTLRPF